LDWPDRPIKGFSGGERQLVDITQSEVNHPDPLILDEPAARLRVSRLSCEKTTE
jgi:ABC-2 type transport system ATP-binding protein